MDKHELPLIIVSIDQGVPFLKGEYSFLLHKNISEYFSTKTIGEDKYFYLTLSTDENSTLDLTDFSRALSFTGPIGFKCKLKESMVNWKILFSYSIMIKN